MQSLYCGLELHSTDSRVVGITEEGEVIYDQSFPTSGRNLVEAFSTLKGQLHIHLEASEMAGWARTLLLERVGHARRVVAGHPKSNRWIANDPLKEDGLDAWKLAELIRMGRLHPVHYPLDRDLAAFKKTVRHYEDLTAEQAGLQHKLKSSLRVEGVHVTGPLPKQPEQREALLEAVEHRFCRETIRQLFALLDHAVDCQQAAFELMRRQSERFAVIEPLQEVPGIGLKLACRFVAYIQNPHRFATRSKLWRYCRLGIRSRSSNGKPLGYQRLDHNGNGRLKDLSRKAFMAALRRGEQNAFQRFYRRSLERTGHKDHARLNTQRKILAVMWAIWRKGERYDDHKAG